MNILNVKHKSVYLNNIEIVGTDNESNRQMYRFSDLQIYMGSTEINGLFILKKILSKPLPSYLYMNIHKNIIY